MPKSNFPIKRKWPSMDEEDVSDEEKEELELEDLLERLLASQKELFEECQRLRDILSQVQQQSRTLNN